MAVYLIAIGINILASFFVLSAFFVVFAYDSSLSVVDIILKIYLGYDFWIGFLGYNLICFLLFSLPLVFFMKHSKKQVKQTA